MTMGAKIPHGQIQRFIDKGIDISGGTMMDNHTYLFPLRDKDHGKFLEIVREEIAAAPHLASEALKSWVDAQENEMRWKSRLSGLPDAYSHHVPIESEG